MNGIQLQDVSVPVQIKAQLPYTTAEDLKPVKSYSSAQQNVDRRQKAEVTPDYMLLIDVYNMLRSVWWP